MRGYLTKVVQSTLSSSFAEVELATRLNAPWIILLAPVLLAPLAGPQSALDLTSCPHCSRLGQDGLLAANRLGLPNDEHVAVSPAAHAPAPWLLAAMLCTLFMQVLAGLAWRPYEMRLMRATNLSLAPLVTFGFLVLADAAGPGLGLADREIMSVSHLPFYSVSRKAASL